MCFEWTRYFDETERDFEMMNGPQRGRRSQHHSRPRGPSTPGVHQPHRSSGRHQNAETDLGGAASSAEYPSTASSSNPAHTGSIRQHHQNDPHAAESGYYNKYASMTDDQAEQAGRSAHKNEGAEQQRKSVSAIVKGKCFTIS